MCMLAAGSRARACVLLDTHVCVCVCVYMSGHVCMPVRLGGPSICPLVLVHLPLSLPGIFPFTIPRVPQPAPSPPAPHPEQWGRRSRSRACTSPRAWLYDPRGPMAPLWTHCCHTVPCTRSNVCRAQRFCPSNFSSRKGLRVVPWGMGRGS